MKHSLWALVLLAAAPAAWPQGVPSGGPVYRCPGPPILYTDQITEREAKEKNCRTIEGAPVTIVQTPKPARAKEPIASGPREGKVDPNAQRQRDGDARKLLEAELRREEARLADLRKDTTTASRNARATSATTRSMPTVWPRCARRSRARKKTSPPSSASCPSCSEASVPAGESAQRQGGC